MLTGRLSYFCFLSSVSGVIWTLWDFPRMYWFSSFFNMMSR